MPNTRIQLLELLKQIKNGEIEAPEFFHALKDETIKEANLYLTEMARDEDPLKEIKKSTD